jgi:hypothetical protein
VLLPYDLIAVAESAEAPGKVRGTIVDTAVEMLVARSVLAEMPSGRARNRIGFSALKAVP